MAKLLTTKNKQTFNPPGGVVEKYTFKLADGEKIESVYRKFGERAEVYLSSQVGCGVGCLFCACSEEWLIRSLSWKEIIAQLEVVLAGKKYHQLSILFNGIGEPTDNESAVTKAIKFLLKHYPGARIGVTTTGLKEKALKAWEKLPVSLQLSLHAPMGEQREKIIQTLMDIKKVVKAARHWAKARGEKVTVNYLLLKDFNDSYKTIDQLLKLLDPRFFRIMFSHLNAISNKDFPYQESAKFAILEEYVAERGYEVTEFDDVGKQAGAGCGQLSSS